ncbi:MAG TPA: transglutaminase domain-containing protein [Bacteroidales bacterium]
MKNPLILITIALVAFLTSSYDLKKDRPIVSNISKPNYVIVDSLKIGSKQYIDRKYIIKKFPSFLLNSAYIKTANDDKSSKGNDFLSFDVNQKVTVYVALCSTIKVIPSWLKNNFIRTELTITGDDEYIIYKKDFKAGKIILGGNLESDKEEDYGMYTVFVTPQMKIPKEITYITSEPLKEFSTYHQNPNLNIPHFEYESSSDSILKKIKMAFHLDSIAGKGDELSQIINLMKWVHYRVSHNGENSIAARSTLDIVNYFDSTKTGVNCRLMAIILNDIYLACGFKARIVGCRPHEDYSTESHVTNMVFSKTLNKWVYMDPSFMVYVVNKDGILLNHSEFRESLIKNKPIKINSDLNHNGDDYSGGVKAYLAYMTKNLFCFSCPLYSKYGYETDKSDVTFVNLYPKGYKEQKIKYNIPVKRNNVTYYNIQDDLVFWVKPNNE